MMILGQSCQCCNEASKIFSRRSVFVFGPFQIVKESSKLQRFWAEDPEDFWDKIPFCRINFEGKLTNNGKILWMKIKKTY